MSASAAPSVRRNPARHRFELEADGRPAGNLVYREREGVLELVHTEVDDAFQGRGLAAVLAKAALDDARAAGQKVVPSCAYVASYIKRHPEYRDLVAS
ncbi:GNAT family N-acetyltransferase [Ramlibacter sp. MMS24-I3-19]|uniref:GNAT family N-acetyltransferase n=1 Tax=Ramlibacter sp. MMS24-I3-19 TaxID=3416606 RepID=UPI003D01DEE2